jgi:hypothetical protein
MTLAEQEEASRRLIRELAEQVGMVLAENRRPMGLPDIELDVRLYRRSRGLRYKDLSTFNIRDAIQELVHAGVARYRLGRDVELVEAPASGPREG